MLDVIDRVFFERCAVDENFHRVRSPIDDALHGDFRQQVRQTARLAVVVPAQFISEQQTGVLRVDGSGDHRCPLDSAFNQRCLPSESFMRTLQFTSFIDVPRIPAYFPGRPPLGPLHRFVRRFAMKSVIRVAGLLTMFATFATLGSATTWSGVLADAKCYASFRGDTRSSTQFVERDTAWMIRYCAPRYKTGCFVVVPVDGRTFPLDSRGNAEAWALVRKIGRRRVMVVQVAGVKKGKDVEVSTIKVTKVLPRHG
jgi:hypothetical protein